MEFHIVNKRVDYETVVYNENIVFGWSAKWETD